MPAQVLYFDVGQVLLSFSHERMCAQMAEVAGVSMEAMRDAIFGRSAALSALVQYETGHLSTDEYFDVLCSSLGRWPDRRQLAQACCDIFAPIEDMWALVRRLAAGGHRLAILSNTNPIQMEYFTDGRFPLLARIGEPGAAFRWAILSYEVHTMKPAAAIYEAAIARAGVAAGEIFFIDDRPENVAGARAVGIDAVQFLDYKGLAFDLRERGVPGV